MQDGQNSNTRQAKAAGIGNYGIASAEAASTACIPIKMGMCKERFFGSPLADWAWWRIWRCPSGGRCSPPFPSLMRAGGWLIAATGSKRPRLDERFTLRSSVRFPDRKSLRIYKAVPFPHGRCVFLTAVSVDDDQDLIRPDGGSPPKLALFTFTANTPSRIMDRSCSVTFAVLPWTP
jgi:hypothetical protein